MVLDEHKQSAPMAKVCAISARPAARTRNLKMQERTTTRRQLQPSRSAASEASESKKCSMSSTTFSLTGFFPAASETAVT